MLEYLHIRNLALIEDVSLELCPGMNVLSGETGAGKSFILKALSFLLGDRLKADMVRPGAERAIVEGLFQAETGDLLLRRELIVESGRSRIFVNDTLHTQEILKELRPKLITYTSQHAQQKLLSPAFQSQLIERHFPQPALLAERDELVSQLKANAESQKTLLDRQKDLLEKRDLLDMQLSEIRKVAPEAGEEERLEELRQKARLSGEIKKRYEAALSLIYGDEGPGLQDGLSKLEKELGVLSEMDESFAAGLNACMDFQAELTALARRLQNPPEAEQVRDLDTIEARLYELAQLKRKLHRSMAEIMQLQTELEESLSFLDSVALDLGQLRHEEEELMGKLSQVLQKIQPLRHTTAEAFLQRLERELKDLAFSEHVRVLPEYLPFPLYKDIADERIRLLWAPNPGQRPKALDDIASGGELSRFLLALTSLETNQDASTFIFDEVDSGVGGLTLNKLAEKLRELSERHQIILITHWPQLAAQAKRHFQIQKLVTKDSTRTLCVQLSEDDRRQELARMAGGGDLGQVFLSHKTSD
ncbi:MAG: AAA family ATPase [Desulfovibrio sp.]|nr:AAA family ATPase [Desulfovibrio sp.]